MQIPKADRLWFAVASPLCAVSELDGPSGVRVLSRRSRAFVYVCVAPTFSLQTQRFSLGSRGDASSTMGSPCRGRRSGISTGT